MPTALESFALWLSERRDFLRNLEKEAARVLEEDADTDKYRALMCQKAWFLEAFPEEAKKCLHGVAGDASSLITQRLERFSRSASRALELDSVFFMYALLYPEDHKKGEPNDLDILVAEVCSLAGKDV